MFVLITGSATAITMAAVEQSGEWNIIRELSKRLVSSHNLEKLY